MAYDMGTPWYTPSARDFPGRTRDDLERLIERAIEDRLVVRASRDDPNGDYLAGDIKVTDYAISAYVRPPE